MGWHSKTKNKLLQQLNIEIKKKSNYYLPILYKILLEF